MNVLDISAINTKIKEIYLKILIENFYNKNRVPFFFKSCSVKLAALLSGCNLSVSPTTVRGPRVGFSGFAILSLQIYIFR